VLLLDEPFGALDAKVRKDLRRWLRGLHDSLHLTSIFVTHDQEEALEVADRIVLLNHGKVEQIGTPEQVYDHPATPFVYGFLGSVNLFHGRVGAEGSGLHVGEHHLPADGHDLKAGAPAVAFARPHDLDIERRDPNGSGLPATIKRILAIGPTARVELQAQADARIIEVELPRTRLKAMGLTEGEEVMVKVKNVRVFPQEHHHWP